MNLIQSTLITESSAQERESYIDFLSRQLNQLNMETIKGKQRTKLKILKVLNIAQTEQECTKMFGALVKSNITSLKEYQFGRVDFANLSLQLYTDWLTWVVR